MPVQNEAVAETLDRVADLLEIQHGNPFRIRAYRTAARLVRGLARPIAGMPEAELDALPGVGADLAAKIAEIARTGSLGTLRELEAVTPPTLVELLSLPGLGPRRVEALAAGLGVRSLDDLGRACREGRVATLRGFGERTQRRFLEELARRAATSPDVRVLWQRADRVAQDLVPWLLGAAGVERVVVAGSYRRCLETVGDLDVLITGADAAAAAARLPGYEDVERVLAAGPTRSAVRLRGGLQVDVRAVPPESYGAALHYFTGSKAHNIAIRRRGQERGLKLNEYGIFREGERLGGATEEEVFAAVGLPWIPPELREDRGEIAAAEAGALPALLSIGDVRGDLHAHTVATDGRDTIEAMAEAARARGYAYLAITDHTRSTRVAGGLGPDAMLRHLDAIAAVAARMAPGFQLLGSAEVDILEDGSLDLPDAVLARMDIVVASVHARLDQPREAMTRRVLRALDNPRVHVLGHATGRLLGRRAPSAIDLDRVLAAARDRGVFVEINGQPERLDINDVQARAARDMGVRLVVSTDAHGVDGLAHMRLAVNQARRAWATAADVANTRPWYELRAMLRRA